MAIPMEREMLEKMLTEGALNVDDVKSLIAIDGETEYVDFKNGAALKDRKAAAATLREYATGFANANGGILIFGVSDSKAKPPARTLTDAIAPGGEPLVSWATNVLGPMAGAFSPPPRFQAVTVDGKALLLVGVARAPRLIECGGVYHHRFGDSTRVLPPSLAADLLLGRRARPLLEVSPLAKGGVANGSAIDFSFSVDNATMTPADGIVVGIVTWALRRTDDKGRLAPTHLRQYVDLIGRPMADNGEALDVLHVSSAKNPFDLPAFGHGVARGLGLLAVRSMLPIGVRSALYVVAAGHPPDWHQFDWLLPVQGDETEVKIIVLQRTTDRPVVEWQTIDSKRLNP